jgi:hypothetical protein
MRESLGIVRPARKDEVSAIEAVFSLPPHASIDTRHYFEECTHFASEWFGGAENILAADVHLDQAIPHCHVLVVPLLNGKMEGSKMFWGNASGFADLHTAFFERVASKHGLKRPRAPMATSDKKHASKQVQELLSAFVDDAARWAAVREAILRSVANNPRSFLDALGVESPEKRLRTFEEIALSSGAGPRSTAAAARSDAALLARAARSKGADDELNERTLSCVGFATTVQPSLATPVADFSFETTRVRDIEFDVERWNPDTGEFVG